MHLTGCYHLSSVTFFQSYILTMTLSSFNTYGDICFMVKSSTGMIKFLPPQTMVCRLWENLSCSAQPVFPSKLVGNYQNTLRMQSAFQDGTSCAQKACIIHWNPQTQWGLLCFGVLGFLKEISFLTSNSAWRLISSALCLLKINSASLATLTKWSFIVWLSNLRTENI